MDPNLAAQAIGGAGFLILVLATFARSRDRFLVLDLTGLVPVAIHYAMLDAIAGLVFSVFYMCVDTAAWWLGRGEARPWHGRAMAWGFQPLVAVLTWVFWAGPVDLAAAAGTVLAITARQQREVWRIQAVIAASTCGWGLYGFLVDSWSQIAFSTAYGLAALVNAVRFFPKRT